MDEIESLRLKIELLEKENIYLKNLLKEAGICCEPEKSLDIDTEFGQNQGSRIILKTEFSKEDINNYFKMFWGRMDVYSRRVVSKTNGTANYYPQCYKFWKADCPKKIDRSKQCSQCKSSAFIPLTQQQIIEHLKGFSKDAEDVIGVYPLFPDDTCRSIVFDFDNHEEGSNKIDYVNTGDTWKEEVDALRAICKINGIDALVERSRSGKGAHLWIFFQGKIEAKLARKFGNTLLKKGAESVDLKSFCYYDRMLPMQDHMPKGGFGNLIALPLQGQALKNGNSAFVDEYWNAYPDQWEVLLSKKKLSKEFIEEKIKEWTMHDFLSLVAIDEIKEMTGEKPWDKSKDFQLRDVTGSLQITLADAIYVDGTNLVARIRNQIRELASFSNPVFYKNQAIGLSNFKNSRYIYLGKDVEQYIQIPRGLLDTLKDHCRSAGITYEIEDKRCKGHHIDVQFCGELKEIQMKAVQTLEKYDNGILHAATAFGKTVVACNMIARKQVNTLILLQSSALMEQWEKVLGDFLTINEKPPEYQTPTGRVRIRKSVIGRLQGGQDTTTGIIDIAMAGSLCKKGVYHGRLKQYGIHIFTFR